MEDHWPSLAWAIPRIYFPWWVVVDSVASNTPFPKRNERNELPNQWQVRYTVPVQCVEPMLAIPVPYQSILPVPWPRMDFGVFHWFHASSPWYLLPPTIVVLYTPTIQQPLDRDEDNDESEQSGWRVD